MNNKLKEFIYGFSIATGLEILLFIISWALDDLANIDASYLIFEVPILINIFIAIYLLIKKRYFFLLGIVAGFLFSLFLLAYYIVGPI